MLRLVSVPVLACSLALALPAYAQQKPGRVTLSSLSLEPASVVGGAPVTGRVTLTAPAPHGGFAVGLTSGNASVASVPGQVTVPAGATAATFTIATHAIGAAPKVVPPPLAVTITGSHTSADPVTRRVEQVTRATTLTVLPPVVKEVGFASHALSSHALCTPKGSQAGGTPLSGCVILTGPAPSGRRPPTGLAGPGFGGAAVTLTSRNPAIASVPTTVTVAAGQTRIHFAITTTPVAADTPVVLSAQRGQSDAHSATLTVEAPRLKDFTLSQPSIQGGGSVEGTVKLTGPVATGAQVVVELRTAGGGGAAVSIPASVLIPAGRDGERISIRTQPVTSPTSVTIGAAYAGVTKTVTLTITPAPVVALASLACNPTTVAGGSPVTCTVSLTGPAPSGGALVSLSSNLPAVAAVPAGGITVAAGQSSSSFAVTTSQVTSSGQVTISASYGGSTKTVTLTVNPVVTADLSIHSYRLTDITGKPLPDTSGTFDLYVTVANAPNVGASPASTLRVQVTSSQPVFGYPQTRTATTPSLAPGGLAESGFRFNGLTRGYTYTFNVCADAGSVVPETNETNNCTVFSITQH